MSLFHGQAGAIGEMHDLMGDAADDDALEIAEATGPQHKQVGFGLLCGADDGFGWVAGNGGEHDGLDDLFLRLVGDRTEYSVAQGGNREIGSRHQRA